MWVDFVLLGLTHGCIAANNHINILLKAIREAIISDMYH